MLCPHPLALLFSARSGDCHATPAGCSALLGRGRRDGQTDGQQDVGPRGRAHREGGLGHLAAVVRDAPTQAARDATAVVLLLAAHHRLHGVAAHPDGSLWPRGTGDSGSPPPGGLLQPKAPPAPGPAPAEAHRRAACLLLHPAAPALPAALPRASSGSSGSGRSCAGTAVGFIPQSRAARAECGGRARTSPGALAPAPRVHNLPKLPEERQLQPSCTTHSGAHPSTAPWIRSRRVCKEPPALPAACTAGSSVYQPLNITVVEASHPHQHKCFWSSACLCLINTSHPKCFCCSFGPLVSAVVMEES